MVAGVCRLYIHKRVQVVVQGDLVPVLHRVFKWKVRAAVHRPPNKTRMADKLPPYDLVPFTKAFLSACLTPPCVDVVLAVCGTRGRCWRRCWRSGSTWPTGTREPSPSTTTRSTPPPETDRHTRERLPLALASETLRTRLLLGRPT